MTDLLRLKRLAFVDSYEEEGFLIVRVASPDPWLPFGCCLWNDKRKNGTKVMRFRDHAIQGQPVWLEIRRQRYKCNKCGSTTKRAGNPGGTGEPALVVDHQPGGSARGLEIVAGF